jgi:hypothetical protein
MTLSGFMARSWRRPFERTAIPPPDLHRDRTVGRAAVTDREIRETGSLVPTGTRNVIHP